MAKFANVATTRDYNKTREGSKFSGYIGKATLTVDDHEWKLNGVPLPRNSIEYLLHFSLQSLQDAYAGATDLADAQSRFEGKLANIQSGDLNARGEGVDSFTKVARQVVYAYLKLKKPETHKEIKDMDSPADKATRLDDIYGKNEAVFKPMVEKEIAARKAAADEKKALAESIEIEI